MKCFEHFFEPSPNELAAFKLVAKYLQESNLKGIGIFMSNITVITRDGFSVHQTQQATDINICPIEIEMRKDCAMIVHTFISGICFRFRQFYSSVNFPTRSTFKIKKNLPRLSSSLATPDSVRCRS